MTKLECTQVVALLAAAYPTANLSAETVQVYQRMLMDLDFKEAKAACARLMSSSKWLPTIAEIRSAAIEATLGPRRTGMEAHSDVAEAVRRHGAYRSCPEFSDPLVAECVRLMGWRDLCLGQNDVADRARFCELYDTLAERQRRDEVAGHALPAPKGGLKLAQGMRALPKGAA